MIYFAFIFSRGVVAFKFIFLYLSHYFSGSHHPYSNISIGIFLASDVSTPVAWHVLYLVNSFPLSLSNSLWYSRRGIFPLLLKDTIEPFWPSNEWPLLPSTMYIKNGIISSTFVSWVLYIFISGRVPKIPSPCSSF